MFEYCSSLTSLDLSKFDTSKVTRMHYMFEDCKSLIELKLNNANFSKIEVWHTMFKNVSNITVYVKDQDAANFINSAIQDDGATGTAVIQPLQS